MYKHLVDIMLSEDSGAIDNSIAINLPSPMGNKGDMRVAKEKAASFMNTVPKAPNEDIAALKGNTSGNSSPSAEVERNIKVWTQSRIIEYVQSEAFMTAYIDRFGVNTGYSFSSFTNDIIKNIERSFKFKLQQD